MGGSACVNLNPDKPVHSSTSRFSSSCLPFTPGKHSLFSTHSCFPGSTRALLKQSTLINDHESAGLLFGLTNPPLTPNPHCIGGILNLSWLLSGSASSFANNWPCCEVPAEASESNRCHKPLSLFAQHMLLFFGATSPTKSFKTLYTYIITTILTISFY